MDKLPITIFHGSEFIIKKPEFGKGRENNDYGPGFYCTKNKGLAGEWAVLWTERDGHINEYKLDCSELETLKLDELDVKHWIAILMHNRKGKYKEEIVYPRIEKFTGEYLPDLVPYDIIAGWRADDAFFSFVEDFMLGLLSFENLAIAMKFGDLGLQTCLKSRKAFGKIEWMASYPASSRRFLKSAQDRDEKARSDYRRLPNKARGTLISDIIGRD